MDAYWQAPGMLLIHLSAQFLEQFYSCFFFFLTISLSLRVCIYIKHIIYSFICLLYKMCNVLPLPHSGGSPKRLTQNTYACKCNIDFFFKMTCLKWELGEIRVDPELCFQDTCCNAKFIPSVKCTIPAASVVSPTPVKGFSPNRPMFSIIHQTLPPTASKHAVQGIVWLEAVTQILAGVGVTTEHQQPFQAQRTALVNCLHFKEKLFQPYEIGGQKDFFLISKFIEPTTKQIIWFLN